MFRRLLFIISLLLGLRGAALAAPDLFRQQLPQSVPHYLKWGNLFVYLQVHIFKVLFLTILVITISLAFLHFIIIGPKKFKESGRKIKIYGAITRIVHWTAAFSFTIIVPTGLIIVFAKVFGGGMFVRYMRTLHFIGAIIFAISIIPMFVMWVLDMLPEKNDISWFLKGGGYLTKKNIETGAGKFNPGQKIWFWIAMFFGSILIVSGLLLYIRVPNFVIPFIQYEIDGMRLAAIVHNFSAMVVLGMFLVHLYMSLFAVKGSLRSMLTGYKDEEEIKYLHSGFYEKIKNS